MEGNNPMGELIPQGEITKGLYAGGKDNSARDNYPWTGRFSRHPLSISLAIFLLALYMTVVKKKTETTVKNNRDLAISFSKDTIRKRA